jgi:radical SAM superfamily enzyme YgiQ (UPF0313 family)
MRRRQSGLSIISRILMKLKVLLINPWIYDFAAANLWSRPLGLFMVAEYMSQFSVELAMIDCLDVFRMKKYGKGSYPKMIVPNPECLRDIPRKFGRYGMTIHAFRRKLRENAPFDLVLLTSIMSYWYPGVQKVIEIVRSECKNVPIILGGIYATLWQKHAAEHSGADFIYKGQISNNITFALSTFGFKIKKKSNGIPYYRMNFYNQYPFAPVLTSTGCPFACSYCGTKLLHNGFTQRDPLDVAREIKELSLHGVRDFAFYDDALFVNADSHIKIILREIVRCGLDLRFHCPNGLHTRFLDDELALFMKQSDFKTLRLSLETVDRTRQRLTGKVSSDDLVRAVRSLKKHGFSKENIGVYLMYGLPGQDLDEVQQGVRFLKDLDVRINLTEFSPIPGTACWNELVAKGIITDGIDPLLTNNSVFSYLFSGYNHDELQRLKDDVNTYNNQPPPD